MVCVCVDGVCIHVCCVCVWMVCVSVCVHVCMVCVQLCVCVCMVCNVHVCVCICCVCVHEIRIRLIFCGYFISRKEAKVGFTNFFCSFYFRGRVCGPRSQT